MAASGDNTERPGRMVLPNGLVSLTVERESCPLVAVMLMYRAGSFHDPPRRTGLAHLVEHMMFRGTPRFPHGALDHLTGALGGVNNAMTTGDHALYYFVLPAEHWRTPLEIEADRMRNCVFDTRALETERRVALEERMMLDDDPESRLFEAVDAMALTEHPYRFPVVGLAKDLRRMSVTDLRRFYEERYVPGNAVLSVVGGVERSRVEDAVLRLFGGIRGDMPGPETVCDEPPVSAPRSRSLRDGSATPRLVTAFHSPGATEPDSPAMDIIATLLSSGRSSRLYGRLVEGSGLASEVTASRLIQRDPSLFYVSATLHSGSSAEDCEREILQALRELIERDVPPEELRKAKDLTMVDALLSRETCLGAAGALGFWELLGGWELEAEYEASLDALDAAAVRRAAASYLRPETRSTVWLEH